VDNLLSASKIDQYGLLDASNFNGAGGRVILDADAVALAANSDILATGTTSGGTAEILARSVLAKGDVNASGAQSGASLYIYSEKSFVAQNATLAANSSLSQGGQVKVVSQGSIEIDDSALSADGQTDGGLIRLMAEPTAFTQSGLVSQTLGLVNGTHRFNPTGPPTGPPGVTAQVLVFGASSLSANGNSGSGGKVVVTGDEIQISGSSAIYATGGGGGGHVRIGGDWQGGSDPTLWVEAHALYQSNYVLVDTNVVINASAISNGDGGRVVVWSDVSNPSSETLVTGTILAKGGLSSGSGGNVETSGYDALRSLGARVDTSAPYGETGIWLVDPYNYVIGSSEAAQVVSALSTSNLTINTANQSFSSTLPGTPTYTNTRGHTLWTYSVTSGSLVRTATYTYDSYGTSNSTAMYNRLVLLPVGDIAVIGSWDASSLDQTTRNYLNANFGLTQTGTWFGNRIGHIVIAQKATSSNRIFAPYEAYSGSATITSPITDIGNYGRVQVRSSNFNQTNSSTASWINTGAFVAADPGTDSGTITINSAIINNSASNSLSLVAHAGITINANIDTIGSFSASTSSGAITINNSRVYVRGTQSYSSPVEISGTVMMSTVYVSGNYQAVTFSSTINASASASNPTLEIYGNTTFSGNVGATKAIGALTVNGDTSLAASVTTTGTQRYNNPFNSWGGATTISAPVTLTTTNSNVTFFGTVNSSSSTPQNLTAALGTGTLVFGDSTADTVGATNRLGNISITGNLDLNAALSNTGTISVSGTSDLGANVTSTSTQTYTGNSTISTPVTLTTTESNITFGGTLASASSTAHAITVSIGAGTLNLPGTAASSNRIGNLALTGNLSTGTSFANAGTISVSGTSSLGGSITSTGAQTYTGNATLAANLVTLTNTNSNITFSGSVTLDFC
jgi:hypothetical protein